ncbi:MAG: type II toxin-antitoxin system RnlA family toxin [Clostridiales bacterium]|nr:type II toxin-antitoxin system RnlA family toxin [Clostridiales bacterium]
MDNVRYNISPCERNEVAAFIDKIDVGVFVPNGAVKATERSHYDRYSFLASDNRIAIVYDTSASIVSITGRSDYARQLLDLFNPKNKTVKRSTVPAQGSTPVKPIAKQPFVPTEIIRKHVGEESSTRAKLFVEPDQLMRRSQYKPVATVFASSKGALISTDEIYPPQTVQNKQQRQQHNPPPVEDEYSGDIIYPPQTVKKRTLPSYGETSGGFQSMFLNQSAPRVSRQSTEHSADNDKQFGIAISAGGKSPGGNDKPRRAVISFGSEEDEDDDGKLKINTRGQSIFKQSRLDERTYQSVAQSDNVQPTKRKRGRPPKVQKAQNNYVGGNAEQSAQSLYNNIPSMPNEQSSHSQDVFDNQPVKRKRGRPSKTDYRNARNENAEQIEKQSQFEYKNGYSVKNYPPEALSGAIKRLREYGKTVIADGTEFAGTPQEVKSYSVTDAAGQKVLLRYATKRMTLQLQGKRSDLFGEVMSQVSHDSDYSSALENYVENTGANAVKKVSDVQNELKKRLPNAFEFLSEQSRIDFSYGIHDFGQTNLHLLDYSVLLVPAFRGLERFVFDLQRAEDIKVKMIGQAFDKDDSGKYVLKSGYCQRIGSVIYAEVLVALYTEYFSQRNFFAHSDNTDNNISRSLPERATALHIFNHLLDVVEYNAKKLKEIGFTLTDNNN